MKKQDLQVGDKVKIVRCCSVECGHDCLGTIGTLKIIDSDSTILPYKVGRVWAHKVEKVGSRGRPKGSKNKPKVKDYIVFDGGYYCIKHEAKNCTECFSQGETKTEIKIPKCPKTLMGTHRWHWEYIWVNGGHQEVPICHYITQCVYCGIIDDRAFKND